jgi:hypothetical protein
LKTQVEEFHIVFECSRYSLPGFDCIVICLKKGSLVEYLKTGDS